MEIWQLNTFCIVAKELHFTRASEELNLTQSAVSYQIKSLEEELGVKLFNRNKRKITLTSKGETVLAYANKMLDQVAVMKREIKENRETLSGELKLVAATRSLDSPFPQIKRDFQKIYENIDLSFRTVINFEDGLNQIKKGKYDIGFTMNNEFSTFNYENLLMIPWGEFKMVFVVGKNHHLAEKKGNVLEDLIDEEWILFEEGSWVRDLTKSIFRKYDFAPKKTFETNDGATILSMVKDGQGITILPSWGIVKALKMKTLIPLKLRKNNVNIPLKIVVSSANRSKLVSAFVNFLLETEVEGIHLYKQTADGL